MGWMWLWWLVGLALLIVIVWAVARAATPPSATDHQSPEAILKAGTREASLTSRSTSDGSPT
jgi:hypothetical protein